MERRLQGGFCCSWSCLCSFAGRSSGLRGCSRGSGCRSCCGRCSRAPPGLLSPMKGAGNTRVPLSGGGREGLAGQGERAARGCADHGGDREGPAVSASSPLCGSGVFLPHGTQGRFVQFSQFDSPQGWGGGEKGKPHTAVRLQREASPRPLASPRIFLNYNLEGFCFSSRLLGRRCRRRRRRRRFTRSRSPSCRRCGLRLALLFLSFFLLFLPAVAAAASRCPGPAAAAESFSSGPSRVK